MGGSSSETGSRGARRNPVAAAGAGEIAPVGDQRLALWYLKPFLDRPEHFVPDTIGHMYKLSFLLLYNLRLSDVKRA